MNPHFQIEGHRLHMIASDSFDFTPKKIDIFVSTSGERYDFVPIRKDMSSK